MRIFSGFFAFRSWAKRTTDALKCLSIELINPDAIAINSGARLITASVDGTEKFGVDTDGNPTHMAPVAATAATLAVTAAAHANRTIVLDRAAGITATLPAATGTGNRYTFFTKTTVTSNNNIIQVVTDDTMKGTVWMAQDGGDTSVAFETASDSDTITMNGSTKGGLVGDRIDLIDVATDVWSLQAFLQGTGIEATPLSAAVT